MGRPRKGSVYEKKGRGLVAQLDWIDDAGKPRQRREQVASESVGWKLIDKWKAELDSQGEAYLDASKITFLQLAAEYEAKRLVPAEYRNEKKVKGMRDWKDARRRLKISIGHFGKKRIRSITYADIENFRDDLLGRPVIFKNKKGVVTTTRERSIGDVHRILARLSGAFTYAIQKEWLVRSPFSKGENLIVMAQEVARERCLSTDEQRRLLQACQNDYRQHVFPLILTALDSGCRRGELLKLKWCEVDLDRGELRILAMNAKSNKRRTIDLEPLTVTELRRTWEQSTQNVDGLVFGIKNNFNRAWESALKAAEITIPTRFHDLRASIITYGILRGRTMEFAMKRSGHADPRTFMRYVRMAEEVREKQREQLREWELASSLTELAGQQSESERLELIN
jgi:integrase